MDTAKGIALILFVIAAFICALVALNFNDNQNIRLAQIEAIKAGASIQEAKCLQGVSDYERVCGSSLLLKKKD